jgi:hypothetical protein
MLLKHKLQLCFSTKDAEQLRLFPSLRTGGRHFHALWRRFSTRESNTQHSSSTAFAAMNSSISAFSVHLRPSSFDLPILRFEQGAESLLHTCARRVKQDRDYVRCRCEDLCARFHFSLLATENGFLNVQLHDSSSSAAICGSE